MPPAFGRVGHVSARVLSSLRLQFTNGTVWDFGVPKIGKKSAKELVAVLGGSVI